LGVDALGRERVCREQRLAHGRAPRDERHVAAAPEHEGGVERQRLAVVLDLGLAETVDPLGLEEHDRVGGANGREQQAVCACPGRWRRSGARNATGSGWRMAASSRPYARAGDAGATTRRPGMCANSVSVLSE